MTRRRKQKTRGNRVPITEDEWLKNRAKAAPAVMVRDIDKVKVGLSEGVSTQMVPLERAQAIEAVYVERLGASQYAISAC